MIPPPDGYMVYLLIDPRDRVPFYAGMTCRPDRRWYGHSTDRVSAAFYRLEELRSLRLKCRVRVLATDLLYAEARVRERQAIQEHKPTLLNRQVDRRRASTEAA